MIHPIVSIVRLSRPWLAGWVLMLVLVPQPMGAQKGGSFGSKDPGLYNLKGTIYALPEDTDKFPSDIEKLESLGVIYTDRLDVPSHEFEGGFAGLTDRVSWFGIVYTARFQVEESGDYRWKLSSEDGSRLWIDGKQVIDNDGRHGEESEHETVELKRGTHDLKVWYFKGKKGDAAIRLYVRPPDGKEQIFTLRQYQPKLAAACKKVEAEPTRDGIRVRIDADVLFEPRTSDLRRAAMDLVEAVSRIVAAYPSATVRVLAFSDSTGDDAYNLRLSDDRAASVKEALTAADPPRGVTFESRGFGRSRPIGSNDTEQGRAKNRRVEIYVKP